MTLITNRTPTTAASYPRRLFAFHGGAFAQSGPKHILRAAGIAPEFGWPGPGDGVLAWGHRPTARRAEWVAARTGAALIRAEDAFFRSVKTGRDGARPIGLVLDRSGCHYDSRTPSDLEQILANHPLSDPNLLKRARDAMGFVARHRLSKYNATILDAPRPDPGYVLVVDQTRGDASIALAGASDQTFHHMLAAAQAENPGAAIVIKAHPETVAGFRPGHFQNTDGAIFWDHPTPVQDLLAGASSVYVVSSQMGFEAICAGHTPKVFGQPFYAGWGLTDDRMPIARRTRTLTADQLFAAACILYPTWYDPCNDRVCDLETALRQLAAETRAWRDDHAGWDGYGMRLWKRSALNGAFGQYKAMRFDPKTPAPARRAMTWGAGAGPLTSARLEDGFLRSRGLGAELVPPLSLVVDPDGIYFDATHPSRLETLIAQSVDLPQAAHDRAAALMQRIVKAKLSKYNLHGASVPKDRRRKSILVPGQVESDASIQYGALDVRTNAALLAATRAANPDAVILYKPHPDVEAGLRDGAVPNALDFADRVLDRADPIAAIQAVDQVWTMTSLLGFEALLHGTHVHCLGHPFYAGWGLTSDAAPHPRRLAHPMLTGLVHAALIDYPRYFDPVSGLPCAPEVAVDRLAHGIAPHQSPALRALAKLQGVFSTYAHWWR